VPPFPFSDHHITTRLCRGPGTTAKAAGSYHAKSSSVLNSSDGQARRFPSTLASLAFTQGGIFKTRAIMHHGSRPCFSSLPLIFLLQARHIARFPAPTITRRRKSLPGGSSYQTGGEVVDRWPTHRYSSHFCTAGNGRSIPELTYGLVARYPCARSEENK
jgi:hypothetical protein